MSFLIWDQKYLDNEPANQPLPSEGIDTTLDLVREAYANLSLSVVTSALLDTVRVVDHLHASPIHQDNSSNLAQALHRLLLKFVDEEDPVRTGRQLTLLCLALFPHLNNKRVWGSLRNMAVKFNVSHALLSKDLLNIRQDLHLLWRGGKTAGAKNTYSSAQKKAYARKSHARFHQRSWEDRKAETLRLRDHVCGTHGTKEWEPGDLVAYCRQHGFFAKELGPDPRRPGKVREISKQFLGRCIMRAKVGTLLTRCLDGVKTSLYVFSPSTQPKPPEPNETRIEAARLVERLTKEHPSGRWQLRDLIEYCRKNGFFTQALAYLDLSPKGFENRAKVFFGRALSTTRALRLVRRQVNRRFSFFYEPCRPTSARAG